MYKINIKSEKEGVREKYLNKYKATLASDYPHLVDTTIDDFLVLGKTTQINQFLVKHKNTSKHYIASIVKKKDKALQTTTSNVVTNIVNSDKQDVVKESKKPNIKIKKLGEIEYDHRMFIPIKSNTHLDYIFSSKGGIMPATNYIIIGDPGIGKSSLTIEFAANVKHVTKDKKVLFISAEMQESDIYEYKERFKKWDEIETVFISDFEDGLYKETTEEILDMGWDLVVIDSIAELSESVKEDYNTSNRGLKMSTKGVEKWLIDLFVNSNQGKNKANLYTSFLGIQQVTKGGSFVGSNKLKHNTTGMIELRYTRSGSRKINVTKNRRGCKNDGLEFKFIEKPKDGEEPIVFDIEKLKREQEIQLKINSEKEEFMNEEKYLEQLFSKDDDIEDAEKILEEL